MRILAGLVAAPLFTALMLAPASAQDTRVLAYHDHPSRSGHFTVPGLTWEKARGAHVDAGFDGRFSGHVYAQPLFWRASGSGAGMVLVATEDDTIHALDAANGRAIWMRSLGKPVTRSSLPCGDIDPLGITGTPVIDQAKEAVYLDAMVQEASGPRHRVFALSLKDGSVLPGWPVDVGEALAAQHKSFDPRVQNERGAPILLDGTLFVPFGGHFGDCGDYHGWVVGFPLDDPKSVRAWETRARGGGIWAPGGISSDGRSLFVSTGNTFGASQWSDGEAVFRLAPSLARSERKEDFFAPADWKTLDEEDADLGGSNPLPLDLTSGGATQPLILALGKDHRAYLLDRRDLGGVGGSLAAKTVSKGPIRTAPASYPAADGTFVAFQGEGADCPGGGGGDLTVLRIRAGSPPSISTAWCGAMRGRGSPMVTTSDGHGNPIVWIVGADGDDRLHGFRGDTGEPLVSLGGLSGLRRFQTLIAAQDRLYVAADGRLYAVAF
jgi:hypothetical protein